MLKHSPAAMMRGGGGGGGRGVKRTVHRVWTAATTASSHTVDRSDSRVMEGREVKTRQGNRQWVSRQVAGELQAASWMRRRGRRGRQPSVEEGETSSRRKKRRSSSLSERKERRRRLVSIEGSKFVVSSGGKKLRRVSSSDTGKIYCIT